MAQIDQRNNGNKKKRDDGKDEAAAAEVEAITQSQVLQQVVSSQESMDTPNQILRDFNSDADKSSSKDVLLNDHVSRLGNKRRFMTDVLCRTLNCDFYLAEAEKPWANDPLSPNKIAIRYSREFPTIGVVFDNFDSIPDQKELDKIIAFKKKLANENGYKYLFQTPMTRLSHTELHRQLDEQKNIGERKKITM